MRKCKGMCMKIWLQQEFKKKLLAQAADEIIKQG
jgi:hypothetical protein